MKKKEITNENLVGIVKEGFDNVNKKFDKKVGDLSRDLTQVAKSVDDLAQITKRGFDNVDKRFNSLETDMNLRFDDVDSKLGNIVYRFEMEELEKKFEKRLQNIERRLGLIKP